MRFTWLVVCLLSLAPACSKREASKDEAATKDSKAPESDEKSPGLAVGDRVPTKTLPGSDGVDHELPATGRYTVVAWFPKAFTGG